MYVLPNCSPKMFTMTKPVAVSIPKAQTMVSKYYFPLKGTMTPRKTVQFQIQDTKGIM